TGRAPALELVLDPVEAGVQPRLQVLVPEHRAVGLPGPDHRVQREVPRLIEAQKAPQAAEKIMHKPASPAGRLPALELVLQPVEALVQPALEVLPQPREDQTNLRGQAAHRGGVCAEELGLALSAQPEPFSDGAPGVREELGGRLGEPGVQEVLKSVPGELEGVEDALAETRESALDGAPEASSLPALDGTLPRLDKHVVGDADHLHEAGIPTEGALESVGQAIDEAGKETVAHPHLVQHPADPVQDRDRLDEVQQVCQEPCPSEGSGEDPQERATEKAD